MPVTNLISVTVKHILFKHQDMNVTSSWSKKIKLLCFFLKFYGDHIKPWTHPWWFSLICWFDIIARRRDEIIRQQASVNRRLVSLHCEDWSVHSSEPHIGMVRTNTRSVPHVGTTHMVGTKARIEVRISMVRIQRFVQLLVHHGPYFKGP